MDNTKNLSIKAEHTHQISFFEKEFSKADTYCYLFLIILFYSLCFYKLFIA